MYRQLRIIGPLGLALAFLASPFLLSRAQEPRPEVRWRFDYNTARKEAADKKLPLVLDFGTQDCVWCRRLDETTFRDVKVCGLMNEKFIPVKIDAERESYLTQRLQISRYPTLVLASHDGKILNKKEGYQDASQFGESLQRVLAMVTEPDWMPRDLQLAEKLIQNKEFARAIALLKNLVEDGQARPSQLAAEKTLEDLETLAQDRLARIREQIEKGDRPSDAVEQLTDFLKTFPGMKVAKDATDQLTRLASGPDLRRQQRSKRAQELLTQAQDFYKGKDYLPCLDRCEILMAGFGDLAEGVEASQLAALIKNDPEWLQNACDVLGDRLGSLYLALADSMLKKGQADRAKFYLERVIRGFPGTRQAESAQIRLGQILGIPATRVEVPTEPLLTRPEGQEPDVTRAPKN